MLSAARLSPIAFLLALLTAHAADAPPSPGVLTLANGDEVPGEFRPSETTDALRWQGAAFTRPFEFVPRGVASIRFPATNPQPKPDGEFALELADGDILSGRITDWAESKITLNSPHFGPIHVRWEAVRRLYRIDDNSRLIYSGPAGLLDRAGGESGWKDEGPHVWTDKSGGMLAADLRIPDQAIIEFELSWTKTPNFAFVVAANAEARTDSRLDGWRFEAWDHGRTSVLGSELVVVRERRDAADMERIQVLSGDVKRVHLIACLDQTKGTMQVFRPDGTSAAKIHVPPADTATDPHSAPGRGIRIINRYGDVRLERLRILRWNGLAPSASDGGLSRFELADGTAVSGEVVGFETDPPRFQIRAADEQRPIRLQDLVAAEMAAISKSDGSTMSAILQDGTRLSGTINEIRGDRLLVASPDIAEPLEIPHAQLRLLTFLKRETLPAAEAPPGRNGRLELGTDKLSGKLASATERPDASWLAWHPLGSRTSSPLKPGAAGRVVYRDREPPSQSKTAADTPPGRIAANGVVIRRVQPQQNFTKLFLKKAKEAPITPVVSSTHNLHLRSGDVVPCTVVAIDDEGVRITSPVAEAQMVPHAKIKAVEFVTGGLLPDLQAAKRDRLLTIPRLQKASPPTHLLCARTGDFLRCRLIALQSDVLRVEIQLEEIEIPRDRVAQVIWFHPNEAEPPEESEASETGSTPRPLAQVIQPNGNRVTFQPHEVDGQVISGTSELLGACRFKLDEIDQIIFGRQIEVAAAELPYHQWQLRAAVEPLVAQDLEDTGGDAGKISPLVGQAAPDFELPLLDGPNFRLSDCRGQIVVLDFWASWCGPCMRTLPLMEEAMREFDPAQVRMVSVNLEEPAKHVKAVLERHELNITVALDVDGVAARRYEANAIPQTVIIDREGKIARLYVGGGRNAVEQLKASLTELLNQ